VVSGDGDFKCLYDFLIKKKKLERIVIPNRHNQPSLLKKLQKYKTFMENERGKLEYKK